MTKKHLATLVFIGGFILTNLLTAVYSVRQSVVIFVVDNFEPDSHHGRSVANIIRRWSFAQCRIVEKNIGKKNRIDAAQYLQALQQIEAYARQHPRIRIIVNLSLGGPHPNEREMIKALDRQKVVIVAAAGNDGKDVPFYPAGFPETIAVASVSFNGKRLHHSNYGPNITLAVEEGEIVADNSPHLFYTTAPGGTSLSTPKVAGVIGHILSQNNLYRQQLWQLLQRHCQPLPANFRLGWGKLHLNGLLWSASALYRLYFCLWLAVAVMLSGVVVGRSKYLRGPASLLILVPLALPVNDLANIIFDLAPLYASVGGRAIYNFCAAAAFAVIVLLLRCGD